MKLTHLFTDYNYRISFIDNLLTYFSNSNSIKFGLLVFIHNILVLPIYYVFFVSNDLLYFSLSLLFIVIQFSLNIIDRGCFLLKLERKYIGKWWFGGYTLLNYIHPSIANSSNIASLFYLFMVFITLFGLSKLFYLIIYTKTI